MRCLALELLLAFVALWQKNLGDPDPSERWKTLPLTYRILPTSTYVNIFRAKSKDASTLCCFMPGSTLLALVYLLHKY